MSEHKINPAILVKRELRPLLNTISYLISELDNKSTGIYTINNLFLNEPRPMLEKKIILNYIEAERKKYLKSTKEQEIA